jgi:hypothetical protein
VVILIITFGLELFHNNHKLKRLDTQVVLVVLVD